MYRPVMSNQSTRAIGDFANLGSPSSTLGSDTYGHTVPAFALEDRWLFVRRTPK